MTCKFSGLLALSLSLSAILGVESARAGAFDGKWEADIPAQGGCNVTATMTLLVAGSDIVGQVQLPGIRHPLSGKLQADGSAAFAVEGRWPGTMSFHGDHFDATWNNGACDRHAAGDRALSDDKRAQVVADRKRHQEVYADLVRRAEAGDKTVDYTALRSESIYAKDWDYYDTKAHGLIDQANAAAKGKDCVSAMAKLDAVIALDFTIDSAHALRSDCLKAAGDHDKARIESDIAKGLIHSLMDSGKGDSLQTAYVVTTLREEEDVLANRHIQLRKQGSEISGGDGRLFELVQGVQFQSRDGVMWRGSGLLTATTPHIDADPRRVYFDISSFRTGQASRRAVAESAVAAIQ